MWYGVSSIAARFLIYLLTPYLTYKLSSTGYADVSILYAAIPFLNVMFTYGLETGFFRFASRERGNRDVYNTATVSILISTVFLTGLLFFYRHGLAHVLRLEDHPELVSYSILIIAFDTLATLPFAKLRLEQRPRKYALIRLAAIVLQLLVFYFLVSVCPHLAAKHPYGFIATFYRPDYGAGYFAISNLFGSVLAFALLYREFMSFSFRFNKALWKEMMVYSLPLIVVGFGFVINETFDRLLLPWLAPGANVEEVKKQVAIYSGCYKLSILINLFVTAFRMGAEPFFFKQAEGQDPQKVYARVLKFFVITVTLMFLFVVMYLDIWKYFLSKKFYWAGLKVVPVLLLANMFNGIYYNLSIWYKLTHKTIAGAYITLIGAAITLVINFVFIPRFSYMASAWATFFCYGSMMVISYIWGQREYRVPYAWKKLSAYILIVVLLYFMHQGIVHFFTGEVANLGSGTFLLLLYAWFIVRVERKEMQRIPLIRKIAPLPAQKDPAAQH